MWESLPLRNCKAMSRGLQSKWGKPRNPLQKDGPITLSWWHWIVANNPSITVPPSQVLPCQLRALTHSGMYSTLKNSACFHFVFKVMMQGFLFKYTHVWPIRSEVCSVTSELKCTPNSCHVESTLRIPTGCDWSTEVAALWLALSIGIRLSHWT